LVKLPSTVGC